jgi:hypothetical protein
MRQPTFRVKRLKFYASSTVFRHIADIAADRDWWSANAGKHYHELAHRLRDIAAKWRLPYTHKVLLDLARRYDTRADRIGRRPINIGGQTRRTSRRAAGHDPIVGSGDL